MTEIGFCVVAALSRYTKGCPFMLLFNIGKLSRIFWTSNVFVVIIFTLPSSQTPDGNHTISGSRSVHLPQSLLACSFGRSHASPPLMLISNHSFKLMLY